MWNFFLIGQNGSSNQRSGLILEVSISKFCSLPSHARQSFHFEKILGGPNINIFWWKWACSFLLHKRTNAEIQIWKLIFKKYHFGPSKKCVFGFRRKPPQKFFSLCFSFDSAFKTIDAQMFFWSVFLKTHKKKLLNIKNAILAIFGS